MVSTGVQKLELFFLTARPAERHRMLPLQMVHILDDSFPMSGYQQNGPVSLLKAEVTGNAL